MSKNQARAHRMLTEQGVFTESKALNERQEYKLWLHVWYESSTMTGAKSAPSIYPWPLADQSIDAAQLAAYMSITKMAHWPGQWPLFHGHWSELVIAVKNALLERQRASFFWKLAPGMGKQFLNNGKYPAYRIPEVFLNALT